MSFNKELDLRYSLGLNFQILTLFGIWLPENTTGIKKILFFIRSIIFVGIGLIVYTISEVINLYYSRNDLTKLSDGLFLFLTHACQLYKFCYFTSNYRRILNLLNSLNRDIFKPRNQEQYDILKSTMFYSKRLFQVYICMCAGTVLLWGAFPIFDKSEEVMQLPLAGWYPFETDKTPVFEIIYLYQICAVLINALTNISKDTAISGFMAHICGQLDVLNNALLHIKDQAIANVKVSNDTKVIDMKRAVQEEMDKELIRCVVHHLNILQL